MRFLYTARSKKGEIERGEIHASSKREAAETLNKKNLTPISFKQLSERRISIDAINSLAPVPRIEKVIFSRQLSTLINAGVPLVQSLGILEKQTKNAKFKKILSGLVHDVEGGSSFSEALKKHPNTFSDVFVNLVHAGEVGGILDQTMERLADQIEKDHEITAKIKGAMMYPAVISIAMIGAVILMMVSVIPQLAEMFDEMNAALPTSTKLLIAISEALTTYGVITFSLFAATVLTIRYVIKKVYKVRKKFHFLILHTPVLGRTTRKINIARFARTFGTLMASGISIVETLTIVSGTTSNIYYKEEITKIAKKVKDGIPLGDIMEDSKNFPVLVSQMISIGEETGKLSEILIKVSEFYEKEVDNIIKNITALLEPFMMLAIGGMIGFVMVSIIKPIYELTNMF